MRVDDTCFELNELRSTLVPVLRTDHLTATDDPSRWATQMVEETRAALSAVLPFTEVEREFLDRILDCGQIEPLLLTDDADLIDRIQRHPWLLWKAQNVREHKGANT